MSLLPRPCSRASVAEPPPAEEEFSGDLLETLGSALWRQYNDDVVHAFVARHLAPPLAGPVLKTDLFEEALGNDGVAHALPEAMVGMDLSHAVIRAAQRRHPQLPMVRADARRLPFLDAALASVLSTSTLDHFDDPSDLDRALRELARVLRPGGTLILTLDNPLNPLLALRNAIPGAIRSCLGVFPYSVGYTCGPRRLQQRLAQAGFRVSDTRAILHFPRALLALAGAWPRRLGSRRLETGILSLLARAEIMQRWPSRWYTGHYIAVVATKV